MKAQDCTASLTLRRRTGLETLAFKGQAEKGVPGKRDVAGGSVWLREKKIFKETLNLWFFSIKVLESHLGNLFQMQIPSTPLPRVCFTESKHESGNMHFPPTTETEGSLAHV